MSCASRWRRAPAAGRRARALTPGIAARGLALAVVLAVAAACGAAPPRCALPAPRDASPRPLLWRVQRPGSGVVWLFGTIHDAGADHVPPRVWSTLDASPAFVSELGADEPDPRRLAALARLPWGQVLDRLLPADDWWELVEAMLGEMTEDELRHARPWYALFRLNAHVARSPRPSMDVALATRARGRGIAIGKLESWEEQLAAVDANVTAADLSNALHGRHALACELAQLRAAYRAGDLPALERALVVPRGARLVGERNRRWLPQLERYLAGDGAFLAVGLGHLLGDQGLVALLERAGYDVRLTPP